METQSIEFDDVGKSLAERRRPGEMVIQGFLFLCGGISVLTTIGIVYELGKEALLFFALMG